MSCRLLDMRRERSASRARVPNNDNLGVRGLMFVANESFSICDYATVQCCCAYHRAA